MIMVTVQVADLSHNNFKSSHEVVSQSTFKSFWCQVMSWMRTQVTLGSSHESWIRVSLLYLWEIPTWLMLQNEMKTYSACVHGK